MRAAAAELRSPAQLDETGFKVLAAARKFYGLVDNAMRRATTHFPMTDDEVEAVERAYNGAQPGFINIQQGKRRFWRGQIWKASQPKH